MRRSPRKPPRSENYTVGLERFVDGILEPLVFYLVRSGASAPKAVVVEYAASTVHLVQGIAFGDISQRKVVSAWILGYTLYYGPH